MPTKRPPTESEKTIGQRIARLRRTRGLSQTELAHRMGLKQPDVSEYELGRVRLHAEALIAFCQALRVRPEEILGYPKKAPRNAKQRQKIGERLRKIASLPRRDQEALLRTIDVYLATGETIYGQGNQG